MAETWTAPQCARHWGVRVSTWTAYAARGQAPPAVGYDPRTGKRLWNAELVRSRKPGAKWQPPRVETTA